MTRAVAVLITLAAVGVMPAGAATEQRTSQLSAQDVNYLQTSISGDRFEILGGKMALHKGATSVVRALGRRLIKDHSKSLREALAEATKYGVKAPQAPTPSMVWELQTVDSMSGATFDRYYTTLELKDHQQDIEETTFEVQHGSNAQIKQSAKIELPTLRAHLALATKAGRSG
jgi:putative membrane protein